MWAAVLFNVIVLIVFLALYHKDPKKSKEALRLSGKSFVTILPLLLIVFILLASLEHVSSEVIGKTLADATGLTGYFVAAFLGAFVHLPLFVTFPIGANCLVLD